MNDEEVSPHGLKTVAGQMISKSLRAIGLEKTETTGELDPGDGKTLMINKAEALARVIWKLALGWDEEVKITNAKTGQVKIVIKHHAPDAKFVDIVYDRIEGRVAPDKESGFKKQPLSEKVGEQAKQRLNAMVEGE